MKYIYIIHTFDSIAHVLLKVVVVIHVLLQQIYLFIIVVSI